MIRPSIRRILELTFFIIAQEDTSITAIAAHFSVPKRTVKEDLLKANQYFMDQLGLADFFTSNYRGVITVNPDYQATAVQHAYEMKLALLKTQTIFNLCVLFCTRTSLTRDEILETLFISEGHLSKLLTKLRLYLQPFSIEISNDEGRYFLTGKETHLRLFMFIFLQDSFQQLEWPFAISTTGKPEADFSSQRRAYQLLLTIFKLRQESRSYVTLATEANFFSLLSAIHAADPLMMAFDLEELAGCSSEEQNEELFYQEFIARLLIPDVTNQPRQAALGQFLVALDHPFCQQVKALLTTFCQKTGLRLSQESYGLYVYYLILLVLLQELFHIQIADFLKLFIPQPTYHLANKDAYMTEIRQLLEALLPDTALTPFFSSLLYSLSLSERQLKIRIYLQMTKDFTAPYILKNRLAGIYNPENISLTDDEQQADIIITDTLEGPAEGKTVFYLDSINNEAAWEQFLILVRKHYMEKRIVTTNPLLQQFPPTT